MSAGSETNTEAGAWVRRPLWLVVLIALGAALLSWFTNAFADSHPEMGEPVQVDIHGLGTKAIHELTDSVNLCIPQRWLDRIEGIDVAIGHRRFTFSREEVQRQWNRIEADNAAVQSDLSVWTTRPADAPHDGEPGWRLVAPPKVHAEPSRLIGLRVGVNYPGDAAILWGTAPWRLLALVAAAAAAVILIRRRSFQRLETGLQAILVPEAEEPRQGPASAVAGGWKWLALGAAVVAAGITIVEACQPYYFTQDDNFSSGLPVILQGCRSAFGGVFPEWNPYQFLGMPTTGSGLWCLSYPPTYLSYALATYLLHDEYLTLEVFAILHLLAGYAATYWAMRKVGVRASVAVLGGVATALAGYTLIAGRCWIMMTTIAVYLPLLVVALVNLERGGGGWRWALLTGLVIGLFYAVGFTQIWIYAMAFFFLAAVLLLATGRLRVRPALWIVPAALLGLALSAPLWVVQLDWAVGMQSTGGGGSGVEEGLLAMLLPYPLTHAMDPNHWAHEHKQLMTQFYYSGTLFCAATFVILAVLLGYRWSRRLAAANVWAIVAGVVLVLALGDAGVVGFVASQLPAVGFLNNNPFRILPFFNLFAVLGGGLLVERCLNRLSRPRRWEIGLGIAVAGLMLYHAFLARPAFWNYGDTPYPPMPESMAATLHPGDEARPERVIPFAPTRTTQKGYVLSLEHNFSSVYSVSSFDIYDPIVWRKPQYEEVLRRLHADPISTARAYGIRWVIIDRLAETTGLPGLSRYERLVRNGLVLPTLKQASRPVLTVGDIEIRDLGEASPLAFSEAQPATALPLRWRGDGVDVDVSDLKGGGTVVINVMNWPTWQASAGRQRLPLEADEWDRLRVTVPAGADQIEVRYTRPWGKGLLVGIILAAMGLAAAGFLSHVARRRANTES
jgi:hypothetical protein